MRGGKKRGKERKQEERKELKGNKRQEWSPLRARRGLGER